MSINSEIVFQEAISHCRHKTLLRNMLNGICMANYKNKLFEEIFTDIAAICKNINQIGCLSIYDITAAICRYYNQNTDKVYIIGGGPKRAIQLLKLSHKTQRIGKDTVKYVEIADVISAFDKNGFYLDENIRQSKNGDDFESYLCNWQKTL